MGGTFLRGTWNAFARVHALVGTRFFIAVAWRIVPVAVLELVALLLIREFFVRVYVEAGGKETAGAGRIMGSEYNAAAIGIVLFLFLIFRLVLGYFATRRIYGVVMAEQQRLSTGLFANYLGQPYRAQREMSRSEQRQTLFISTTSLVHQILFPVVNLFMDLTVAVAVAIVLIVKEPIATGALIAWLGLCFLAQTLATARASERAGATRWGSLNLMRIIADAALGDPRLTKLSASEEEFTGHFRTQAERHGRAVADEAALAQVPVLTREIALISSVCLLIAVLALQDRGTLALVAAIALFAAASVRLLPALQRSVTFVQKLGNYAADLRKVEHDRAIEVEDNAATGPFATPLRIESIRLRDVDFRYPGAASPLLKQVNLEVRRGERILVTGASGAGKSTLILLLCGLLRPDAGQVEVNGGVGSILERIRRGRVALVPQDPFIADLSILANIALPAPPETIDRAGAASLLHKFRLHRSLDEGAGENGGRLSGGERQRIALLRAIQHRPQLLILDEATSQLDVETEALVYRTIADACADATIIAIAHRPPPPALFDRHVTLSDGHLVERLRQVIALG